MNDNGKVDRRRIIDIAPANGRMSGRLRKIAQTIEGITVSLCTFDDGNVVTSFGTINVYHADGWCLVDVARTFGGPGSSELRQELIATAVLISAMMGIPLKQIIGVPRLFSGFTRREIDKTELEHAPRVIRKLGAPNWRKKGYPTGILYLDDRNFVEIETLTAFLRDASLKDRINQGSAGAKWTERLATHARDALRGGGIECVELNIGTVQCGGPAREVGNNLRTLRGQLSGVCVHVIGWVGGRSIRIGGARAYQIESELEDWWILADPFILRFVRRNNLHELLVYGRILACLLDGASANRIVWGPGEHAGKAVDLKLREMEPSELIGAAKHVRTLAKRSLRQARNAGIKLRTGLFCVDKNRIPEIIERGAEIIADGAVSWQGDALSSACKVPRRCAEQLRAVVVSMQQDWSRLAI